MGPGGSSYTIEKEPVAIAQSRVHFTEPTNESEKSDLTLA